MARRRLLSVLLALAGIALVATGVARARSSPHPAAARMSEAQIRSFLDEIAAGFRTGDALSLVSKLHPNVRAIYGDKACESFFTSRKDPKYAFRVVRVRGPGRWVWTSDRLKFTVEWAYQLETMLTRKDGTVPSTIHLSYFKDHLVWFADCGTPLRRGAS